MKNNLGFLMTQKNVTVAQLARDIKVSRGTIYRILDGGTPSAPVMLKLSAHFKKPIDHLFCA